MSGLLEALEIEGNRHSAFRRTLSLLLPVFLVAALMLLVTDRADASSAGAGVAAAAVVGSSSGSQISFQAIICPILVALKALFGGLFGGRFVAIFDRLLLFFGCTVNPSG